MLETFLTGIVAFASTNIDDIFILTLFFADKKYKPSDVYIGQYAGITLLILISVIGSFIGNFIDAKYIGLMGMFPIYLGIKQFIHLIKKNEDQPAINNDTKTGILTIATVTFANGGDNIGIYIPLFTPMTVLDKGIVIAIFMVMVLVWLTVAKYLTKHPLLAKAIAKYGHIITPIVLCLIGIFILIESNSIKLFTGG